MFKDAIKEIILRYLDKNKEKSEFKVIIDSYLLPETVNNLYELAKIKTKIRANGLEFNIFDVVDLISPEDFEVGEFHFPFLAMKFDFTLYDKVEDKILTTNDDDIMFFRNMYQAFRIADKKKDLNKFRKHEYKAFAEAINLAFEKELIKEFLKNNS